VTVKLSTSNRFPAPPVKVRNNGPPAEPVSVVETVWNVSQPPVTGTATDPSKVPVAEPERTLRSICAFLNIEFHPDVLTPYEGTRMTDGITPETLPPGDWNFRNRDRINPLQADAWRDLDLPRTLDEKTLAISAALAYELDAAVASRP